jgi:predicted XRE-type DNA-binding protein
MAKRKSLGVEVEEGSGNVFVDLGFPDAGERKTQVLLAIQIQQILEERRLTQASAARILGVSQPKVSALVNGRLEGFSVERLMTFLTSLGRDVQITVGRKRSAGSSGRIRVALERSAGRPQGTRRIAAAPRFHN